MPFHQTPPRLGNQLTEDALLREYLDRHIPGDALGEMLPSLHELGELSGGALYYQQLQDRTNEPQLVHWDPWGHRIDHIEVTPGWKEAAKLAAKYGVVAIAYERRYAELSRLFQFATAYLFNPSTDIFSCPLAMTDGAARTLLDLKNQALIDRAVPRLTSRDPETMWTSGQWMTERTGGSDVGLSETVARRDGDGFRLYGTKWFTSATTSQMALTLARPEGNGAGGRGLALFYVEVRRPDGSYNGIQVNRLKDKLGTRKVPTAELLLEGCEATPVVGLGDGVRNIAPMLNVTRTWNAVMSASGMRRAVALARDYATRRVAFGAQLSDKPLHVDTLAGMQAEFEGAFLLAFRAVELLGRREAGVATEQELLLLRVLTPIAKLTTAKQAVAVASEALEACGGAGYVEDTGLPTLLRDAQVLPIWEGTTNVLSLDTLRALGSDGAAALGGLRSELALHLAAVRDPSLRPCVEAANAASEHALTWLARSANQPAVLEAGARRFALTLGRALELSLLCGHAQWSLDRDAGRGARAASAARRLARNGVDLLGPTDVAGLDDRADAERLLAL
ncbi:MAG: acyl-CoA dehydrogenase family protein [Polyangia bacterium]